MRAALQRFERTGNPFAGSTEASSAGNGSLMRLAPVPMWHFPARDAMMDCAADSSRTTHAAAECVDACRVLAAILHRAFVGGSKADVVLAGADVESAHGSQRSRKATSAANVCRRSVGRATSSLADEITGLADRIHDRPK